MRHGANAMVVKRGGFLSALAYGLFGAITATIVCASGVGLYAMNVVDRRVDSAIGVSENLLSSLPEILPEIRESLPPALSDALNDTRDPEYRAFVKLNTRMHERPDGRGQQLAIEVENTGEKTVSLLGLRVVLVDENNMPVRSIGTYGATPVMLESDWRGPLLPGSQRLCGISFFNADGNSSARIEITELRTWTDAADTGDRHALATAN
jgi:hypothetical protein